MLFAGSTEDLLVLSEALTQFVDNESEEEIGERGGSSPAVFRARSMLDAINAQIVARLNAVY